MELHTKIKITIANEDQYFARAIKDVIEHHTFKVESGLIFDIRVYNSAQECLNNIEKETDIVLLDQNLENQALVPYSFKDIVKIVKSFCEDSRILVLAEKDAQYPAEDLVPIGVFEFIEKDENTIKNISSALRRAVREKILDHNL